MSSGLADYTGRPYDVLAYYGTAQPDFALLNPVLALPGAGGEVVAGILKLSQRFLLELLTEKGSMPYLPQRGNTFIARAREGSLRTQFDALAAFSAALLDIRTNLQSEEKDTDPDDERYADAQINSITVYPGRLTLNVSVSSRAGTSRKVIAPIPIVPA